MVVCESNHEQIVSDTNSCPMCELMQTLDNCEAEKENAEEEAASLQAEVDRLTAQLEELEDK